MRKTSRSLGFFMLMISLYSFLVVPVARAQSMANVVSISASVPIQPVFIAASDVGAIAQGNTVATDLVAQATEDAKMQGSQAVWFLAGCLLGVIGILIAAIYEPTPPASAMIGKSVDEAMVYQKAFVSAARTSQLTSAAIGCGVISVGSVILYAVTLAATSPY